MLVIAAILALSWVFLRLEKKGPDALGFNQPSLRIREFLIAFLLTGIFAVLQQFTLSEWAGFDWKVNAEFTPTMLWNAIRWNLRSVLLEELVFRGYLLYKLLQWTGTLWGTIISAMAFGVYHWFSMEVLGDPASMLFVLLLTGTWGWVMAFSFAQTRSIFFPFGFHLGWNMISYTVFSNGPLGEQWLVGVTGEQTVRLTGVPSLVVAVIIPVAPVIIAVAYFRMRRGRGQGAGYSLM